MTNRSPTSASGYAAAPKAGPPATVAISPLQMAAVLPSAILVLALAADIAHLVTAATLWEQAAAWLLLAVLAAGLPAVACAVARLLAESRGDSPALCVGPALGDTIMLGLVVANYLLRTGSPVQDLPYGLILSMAAVLVALLTQRVGGELVFRRGTGFMLRGDTGNSGFLSGGRADRGQQ